MPIPYCFNYCGFVVGFKVGKCEFSNLTLLQDYFDYSGPLMIPYENEDLLFHFCQKGYWTFDRDYVEFVDCLGNTDILMMLSLPIYEYDCLFIYLDLNFFQQCFQHKILPPCLELFLIIIFGAVINGITFLVFSSGYSSLVYKSRTDFYSCI